MSRNSESYNPSQQANLRLVRKAADNQPQVIAASLKAARTLDLPQAVSLLVALDILLVVGMTMITSVYLAAVDVNVYLFNLVLFLFLANTVKLYKLNQSYYVGGKMAVLGFCFSLAQAFYLVGHGLSGLDLIFPLTAIVLLFGILYFEHHQLTMAFAQPNVGTVYYHVEQVLKRGLDIVLSAVGLLMVLPVLAVVAFLIWLEDRGPVLFAQARVGLNEEQFYMYKFRSMKTATKIIDNASSSSGDTPVLYKMKNDPRLTRLGKIIRKLSVDELPQLWNVLKGEMSLVGPRPPLPTEYLQMNVHHRGKFRVKPGITGFWQVSGRVKNERHFDAVAYYDNAYINSWCLMHDLEIIFRTIPVVLLQKGAY